MNLGDEKFSRFDDDDYTITTNSNSDRSNDNNSQFVW